MPAHNRTAASPVTASSRALAPGSARAPLSGKIASVAALLALTLAPGAGADVITLYTFGTNGTTPGVATPTTVISGTGATSITAGAGNTIDLGSNQGTPPAPVNPWLRMVPTGAWTTPQLAIDNNGYFEFTVAANAGYELDLSSLNFDSWRGGNSLRGYAVRSSADNFSTTLGQGDIPTLRFTAHPVAIGLGAAAFQDLSAITFRVYSYAPNSGASVEYDNVALNGTATFTFAGHVWTGSQNGIWDTTTPNWTGPSTTFTNGVSDVIFIDQASTTAVTVAGASVAPNSLTFSSAVAYTFDGGDIDVTTTLIKSGSGTTTVNNRVTAASASIQRGTLEIANSLAASNITIAPGSTLRVGFGGSIDAASSVQANGALALENSTQTLAALGGANTGVVSLNGTALNVTGTSAYLGRITGFGSVTKDTPGTLTLGGTTSNYTGGTFVSGGGALQLNAASAAGSGPIAVGTGGTLSLGAAVTAPITLAGGTIGVSANTATPAAVTVTADSTVTTYNPITGATGNDLVLSGPLEGSGDLRVMTINGNNPDTFAFRLRGPASGYTGTITLDQSAKFELQTAAATGSPMGTGKLVLTGGATSTTINGSYSLVNSRNNFAGDATVGNDVEIAGFGAAYFNMLGGAPAGSAMNYGHLRIGDGQAVGAVATGSSRFTLGFASVELTGGNATFIPQPVGNTAFVAPEDIRLGVISESAAGSGITMNGAARLTLTGANTYTGPTALLSGTTVLASGASIAQSSSIGVAAGATLDVTALPALTVPAAQTLGVNGTVTGNVAIAGVLSGSGIVNGFAGTTAGGIVAPGGDVLSAGAGLGVLTTGNLDLAGGTLQIELGKATAGAAPIPGLDYDQILAFDGTAGLVPTVQLDTALTLSVGAGIEMGDVFTLILNQGASPVAGNFLGLAQGSFFTVGGQEFQISYADDSMTPGFELSGGNDVSLMAVPEPGSVALLIGGLATCAFRRRHRAWSA